MSNCTQQVLEIWVQGIAAVSSAGAIGVLGFVSVLLLWKKCIADNFRSFVDTVLLSFGAGAMLGDAAAVTLGFCFFFVLELALPHEHHDHFDGTSALHIHAFSEHPNASRPEAGRLLPPAAELPQLDRAKATVVLLMDALHNLLDGIAIGIAWRYWQQGLALVIAIVLHEIGHETQMADYVFLVSQCGVSERAAAMWNLVGAGLSVAGALLGCVLGSIIDQADRWVLAVSAGGFLYISGTQLLPSLQKSVHPHRLSSALLILIPFGIGLGLLLSLAWFEDNIR